MWIWAALVSTILLGFYDTFKKKASETNSVLNILLYTTLISTVVFLPFILSSLFGWHLGDGTVFETGAMTVKDHLYIIGKAILVSISWITGLYGLKNLPITTAGVMKVSRPVFVLLFSILIFGEQISILQGVGIVISLTALWMLSKTSGREGIDFVHNKWILMMTISIFSGVASALWDKMILSWMKPVAVQGWCNLYVTVIMASAIFIQKKIKSHFYEKFKFDIFIILIAVFITVSDFFYFWSLSSDGAMLSIVSLLRRCAVIITFISGAVIFKEKHLKEKALEMIILLCGMTVIIFASTGDKRIDSKYDVVKESLESYQNTGIIKNSVELSSAIDLIIEKSREPNQIATAYYIKSKIEAKDSTDSFSGIIDLRRACLNIENSGNEVLAAQIFLDYGIELISHMWYSSAAECLEVSIEYSDRQNLSELKILALINLSRAILSKPDRTDEDLVYALSCCLKARDLAGVTNDDVYLSKVLYALTSYYIAVEEYDKALQTAQESVSLMERLYGEGLRREKVRYYQLASCYYYTGQADSALFYAKKETLSDDNANNAYIDKLIADIYKNLYKDTLAAAHHLFSYVDNMNLKEIQEGNQKIINEQMQLSESDMAINHRQIVYKAVFLFLFFIICFIIIISLLWASNRKSRMKQEEEIKRNEEVAQSLKSKLISSDSLINNLHLSPKFLKDQQWDQIVMLVDKMYDGYCTDLVKKGLTQNNVRLASAVKLGFSTSECAVLFGISPSSITRAKNRLKGKLNE